MKASCRSLLSNAVLVWNTIKIGNIVGQLRGAGEQIMMLICRGYIPNGSPPCDSQRTYFHNHAVGNAKAGETK